MDCLPGSRETVSVTCHIDTQEKNRAQKRNYLTRASEIHTVIVDVPGPHLIVDVSWHEVRATSEPTSAERPRTHQCGPPECLYADARFHAPSMQARRQSLARNSWTEHVLGRTGIQPHSVSGISIKGHFHANASSEGTEVRRKLHRI